MVFIILEMTTKIWAEIGHKVYNWWTSDSVSFLTKSTVKKNRCRILKCISYCLCRILSLVLLNTHLCLICLWVETSPGSCPLWLHSTSNRPPPLPAWWHHRPAGLLRFAELERALSRTSWSLSARLRPTAVPLTPYQTTDRHSHGSITESYLSGCSDWSRFHPMSELVLKWLLNYSISPSTENSVNQYSFLEIQQFW